MESINVFMFASKERTPVVHINIVHLMGQQSTVILNTATFKLKNVTLLTIATCKNAIYIHFNIGMRIVLFKWHH